MLYLAPFKAGAVYVSDSRININGASQFVINSASESGGKNTHGRCLGCRKNPYRGVQVKAVPKLRRCPSSRLPGHRMKLSCRLLGHRMKLRSGCGQSWARSYLPLAPETFSFRHSFSNIRKLSLKRPMWTPTCSVSNSQGVYVNSETF